MSRNETVWALDTLLFLSGIAMSPEGEKFVYAVPEPNKLKLLSFNDREKELEADLREPGTVKPGTMARSGW